MIRNCSMVIGIQLATLVIGTSSVVKGRPETYLDLWPRPLNAHKRNHIMIPVGETNRVMADGQEEPSLL